MIPGLRGIEHVGLTVPDMDEAVGFFVDVLGCDECFAAGPFSSGDGWMTRQLGVDARAQITQIRMLRCRNGPNLELFAYSVVGQSRTLPRNSDLGGHHLGFYVEAIEPAVADLRARGLTVLGEPVTMTEGPSAGLTWIYFLAPWGLQLELVSYPRRMAFEASAPTTVWTPSIDNDRDPVAATPETVDR